jgi:hypothetical protein
MYGKTHRLLGTCEGDFGCSARFSPPLSVGQNFFFSCCCRRPPIHNNNQQVALQAAFVGVIVFWVAGWLCNKTQTEQKTPHSNANTLI